MDKFKEFFQPEVIWCLVGLVLMLLELMLPGLIVFFFGLGAWVVALVCLIWGDVSINVQLLVFIVSSVVMLLVLRKWVKGIFIGHVRGKQELTEEMQEFVGEHVTVKAAISPDRPGKVEFHGTDWTAEADEDIPEGTTVKIVGKENLTLKVSRLGKE